MKVKIGATVFSDVDQPIMVILTDFDKTNIGNMDSSCTKYCAAPETVSEKDMIEFMKLE
jgi:hypothetical protein